MAIGDATGFTNPLYSPGINANMATSIYAAEMTKEYLGSVEQSKKEHLLAKYESFCKDRIPNLQRMNVFNYVCMRSPALGPLGPLWQYLIGTGNFNFQNSKAYTLENCHELLSGWDWGTNQKEYIAFSKLISGILDGPPGDAISEGLVLRVQDLSSRLLKAAIATGKYKGRWAGLFRYYDDDLNFRQEKVEHDILARRCRGCGEWKMLRTDMRKCAFCGWEHTAAESMKVLYKS